MTGDDRDAKRRVAELIALIDGLRPVDAGRLEVATAGGGAHPAAHLREHPPQDPRGREDHRPAGRALEVALLSGGTGGAKLARGLLDGSARTRLTVIANTGDDMEVYGAHVSPDPDLVTYWLADAIDERGYGIRGDTWEAMDALEAAGRAHLVPPRRPRPGDVPAAHRADWRAGQRQTEAHAAVVSGMGVTRARAAASDAPVRTRVTARGRELAFQEFMIVERARGPDRGGRVRAAPRRPRRRPRSSMRSQAPTRS